MSLLSRICLLLVVLFVASCGFTPIYKQGGGESSDNLAAVKVEATHDLMGQFFATKLEDVLNPTSKQVEPKYRIETELTKSKIPFAIQQDRTITRYKIIVDANYKLFDVVTGKVIDEGRLRREGGYDKVESDYASYISDEDTTKRIVKELAEDTRIRIMSTVMPSS